MQAKQDQNFVHVGLGVSGDDGITLLPLGVDPVTGYLLLDIVSQFTSSTGATMDKRDQNFVPTIYGVSNVDGITLVPIRTDTNGYLLIELV